MSNATLNADAREVIATRIKDLAAELRDLCSSDDDTVREHIIDAYTSLIDAHVSMTLAAAWAAPSGTQVA